MIAGLAVFQPELQGPDVDVRAGQSHASPGTLPGQKIRWILKPKNES